MATMTMPERRHEGPKRARLSVTVAPDLARALREAAAERGVAVSWIIEDALADRLGLGK